MHEMSLMNNLMNQIDAVASREGAERVVAIKVRLGALSHMSPDHFREHFAMASIGGIADSAELDIETSDDQQDPFAMDVVLDAVEIEVSETLKGKR